MNILFVTPYPPVLHLHGGGVRMYHNIRILAEKHSVRVLAFFENEEERELIESVKHICESVTPVQRVSDLGAHWFSLKPFMVREFGTPAMHAAVDAAIRAKRADVIQCEYLQMAQYKRRGIFSILTIHELYSENAYRAFQNEADPVEKMRLFSRWMSMLNYEISMCNAFDRVVTMTRDDAAFLRSYARRADIRAIPIGIDADYFQPPTQRSSGRVQIVFVGNYRHAPNVEAAEFLLKEVAGYFPTIEVVLAGSHLPTTLEKTGNAVFPGYITDTRRLFSPPDTIFIAPLFSGTGQRVKLLEAFAMEAAVITTSLGAAGFPIVDGKHAILANTPEEFRAAVAALAVSSELRSRLGQAARRMIMNCFTWDRIGRQFLDLVGDAGAAPTSPGVNHA
jgi:glycosyltransferase involved in cell wall biosynthesis